MTPQRDSWRTVLARGLRAHCPRCGRSPLFAGRYTLHETCAVCRFPIDANESNGNTWAFMYISTAGITGVFIAIMLLIGFDRQWMWQWFAVPAAFVTLIGTLRIRKSLAIALEYLADQRFLHPDDVPGDISHDRS